MRLLVKILIILPLLLTNLFAQKEGYIWYFGINAGLDFNTTPPTALTDGQMITQEGCASIADYNGRLLFYTDGVTVWNKSHKVMPNGTDLFGNTSSTQSAVIVPLPGSRNIYYLFTVDEEAGTRGLRYSTLDMTLENGLGDIVEKNIPLFAPVTEKITAVKHRNGFDIWVIVHEWPNNIFQSYLVTYNGVNKIPVISNAGSIHYGDKLNNIGYMKASPRGDKIALTIYYSQTIEILDFNNETGSISNPVTIQGQEYDRPYGIEFSPDGSKLYASNVSGPSSIYQFDLYAGSPTQIINSAYIVFSHPWDYYFEALQVGPDGKVYAGRYKASNLSVINEPNARGKDCQFVNNQVFLKNKECRNGLPTFIQTFFRIDSILAPDNITVCEGDTIFLVCTVLNGVNYSWTGPGSFTSVEPNPVIPNSKLSMSGKYKLKAEKPNRWITYLEIEVIVLKTPEARISHTGPLSFCEGDSVVLSVQNPDTTFTYQWSTGEKSQDITVSKSGKYFLTASNSKNCISRDSVVITVSQKPQVTILSDKGTSICEGDTAILSVTPFDSSLSYRWNTGETGINIRVTSAGKYEVIADNKSGCTDTSSIDIVFKPKPAFQILPDKNNTICSGDTLILSVPEDFSEYKWSTGETGRSITVTVGGTYTVTVKNNNGCSSSNSAVVEVKDIQLTYPPRVKFDTVCTGKNITKILELENTGLNEVQIESFTVFPNGSTFLLSSYSLPVILQSGEKQRIEVSFKPDDFIDYADTLVFISSKPCRRVFKIGLSGVGMPGIAAWLPDTAGMIGTRNFLIPLRAKLNTTGNGYYDINFRAEICYDPRFFHFTGNFSSSCEELAGSRKIVIEGQNVRLTRFDKTLSEIKGVLLLPDSMATPLRLSDFSANNSNICLTLIDGKLKLNEICRSNISRIKAFPKTEISITPNPASDEAIIRISNLSADIYLFNLYDIHGTNLKNFLVGAKEQASETVFKLDLTDLHQGIYLVFVSSPSGSVSTSFILIR